MGGCWGQRRGLTVLEGKCLLMNFFPCICLAKGNILSLLGLGLLFGWFICGLICSTARGGMQVTDRGCCSGSFRVCAHSPPSWPFLALRWDLTMRQRVPGRLKGKKVAVLGWHQPGWCKSVSVSWVAPELNWVCCVWLQGGRRMVVAS